MGGEGGGAYYLSSPEKEGGGLFERGGLIEDLWYMDKGNPSED